MVESKLERYTIVKLGLRLKQSLSFSANMIKNVIAPIQAWLMSQGRCVGCGTSLSEGKTSKHKKGTKVTCKKCGRIFIKDKKGNYRRALIKEV